MRYVKYCLSGEFWGSWWKFSLRLQVQGESSLRDSILCCAHIITILYYIIYIILYAYGCASPDIYIQNSLKFHFQGTCLSKVCTKPMALGLCSCLAKGVQAHNFVHEFNSTNRSRVQAISCRLCQFLCPMV